MTRPARLRAVVPAEANPLLDEWQMFGLAAGWSDNTIRTRRVALERWQRSTGVPLEQMTGNDLAAWLSCCRAPATRATYYRHAKSFYKWLQASGHRSDNPVDVLPQPRVPRMAPRPVATKALRAALEVAGRSARAYILLGAYAGLRVHEIAKLRGEDLDLEAGTLRVVGKGGVEAVVPLHRLIAQVARGWPERGYWFVSPRSQHGHVYPGSVSCTIHNTFARVGYPAVTAHQLRHWWGTNVLRSSGGNLRVAQELLRHASPATTALYTLIEDRERRQAVERLE